LFAELRERLPERECVAFVRRDNAASLRAHLKMGMKDVASFEHEVLILPRTPTDEEVDLVERKFLRRALVGHYGLLRLEMREVRSVQIVAYAYWSAARPL